METSIKNFLTKSSHELHIWYEKNSEQHIEMNYSYTINKIHYELNVFLI